MRRSSQERDNAAAAVAQAMRRSSMERAAAQKQGGGSTTARSSQARGSGSGSGSMNGQSLAPIMTLVSRGGATLTTTAAGIPFLPAPGYAAGTGNGGYTNYTANNNPLLAAAGGGNGGGAGMDGGSYHPALSEYPPTSPGRSPTRPELSAAQSGRTFSPHGGGTGYAVPVAAAAGPEEAVAPARSAASPLGFSPPTTNPAARFQHLLSRGAMVEPLDHAPAPGSPVSATTTAAAAQFSQGFRRGSGPGSTQARRLGSGPGSAAAAAAAPGSLGSAFHPHPHPPPLQPAGHSAAAALFYLGGKGSSKATAAIAPSAPPDYITVPHAGVQRKGSQPRQGGSPGRHNPDYHPAAAAHFLTHVPTGATSGHTGGKEREARSRPRLDPSLSSSGEAEEESEEGSPSSRHSKERRGSRIMNFLTNLIK
jgi:hypothetical protein